MSSSTLYVHGQFSAPGRSEQSGRCYQVRRSVAGASDPQGGPQSPSCWHLHQSPRPKSVWGVELGAALPPQTQIGGVDLINCPRTQFGQNGPRLAACEKARYAGHKRAIKPLLATRHTQYLRAILEMRSQRKPQVSACSAVALCDHGPHIMHARGLYQPQHRPTCVLS